jgi:rsbT co-antagonist protein RsbR
MSASHLKDSTGKYIGGVGYFAPYRPWSGAEAECKIRLEELETRLDNWKALAAPVFELYPGLSVMVVVGHVDINRFDSVTENLLNHVKNVKTRVVLLDLSAAVVDDNSVANQLAKALRTVRLLGATCVIAGMRVSLAQSLEPLMADLGSVKSFSCMELALEEALRIIGYEIRQKA